MCVRVCRVARYRHIARISRLGVGAPRCTRPNIRQTPLLLKWSTGVIDTPNPIRKRATIMAFPRSAVCTFGSFAAITGIAFGLAPVAASEPAGKLIETTCSYEQVDAALQAEAPQMADRLHSRPEAQSKVQELLALPVPERRERIQGFLDRNPDIRSAVQKRKSTPEGQETVAKLNRVAETCNDY